MKIDLVDNGDSTRYANSVGKWFFSRALVDGDAVHPCFVLVSRLKKGAKGGQSYAPLGKMGFEAKFTCQAKFCSD